MKQVSHTIAALLLVLGSAMTAQAGDFTLPPQPPKPTVAQEVATARHGLCQWMKKQKLTDSGKQDYAIVCEATLSISDFANQPYPALSYLQAIAPHMDNVANGINDLVAITADPQVLTVLAYRSEDAVNLATRCRFIDYRVAPAIAQIFLSSDESR